MLGALIECVYAQCDLQVQPGGKILDMSVDLGSSFAQDCPPITYYRLVVRERLWLRSVSVTAGSLWDLEQPIAIFSTTADETLQAPIERAVRSAVAGIVYHGEMWSGNAH